MASRLPRKRLIKVDLPTFGLPSTATMGSPSKRRSRKSSQILSAVSSKLSDVESISIASEAIAKGEVARVESVWSRWARDCDTIST